MKKYTVYNGNIYSFDNIFFDEIVQLFCMDISQYTIYNHYRRKGDDKYSIYQKKYRIFISLKTPQIENLIVEKTINSIYREIERLWTEYLRYGLERINENLVRLSNLENSIIIEYKATVNEVIRILGISPELFKQITIRSPY